MQGEIYDVVSIFVLTIYYVHCCVHVCLTAGFDWIRRIEVMNQVARLLQYMHNYDPCFILGNISSHHFLLDEVSTI